MVMSSPQTEATAFVIDWYPVQRHRFPDSTSRMPSTPGQSPGLSASRVIKKPGVQKPHCSPWASRNASCMGDMVPGSARPSTVRMACPVDLNREQDAGPDGIAVDDHGAGPADAVFAAHVGAGETEVVAQEIREQPAGLDAALDPDPVDLYGDVDLFAGLAHPRSPDSPRTYAPPDPAVK